MAAVNKRDRSRWEETLRSLGVQRAPGALTEKVVEAACSKGLGKRYALSDGDVPGLALLVGANGGAVYWLHYRVGGGRKAKRGQMKIGVAGVLTLDEARKRAREALVKVANGIDPVLERTEATREQITLRGYLAEVFGPQVLKWRKPPRGRSHFEELVLRTWAAVLDLPIRSLTKEQIDQTLTARLAAGRKPNTVKTDWAYLNEILRHAHKAGVLPTLPIEGRPDSLKQAKPQIRNRYLGSMDTDEDIANKTDERSRFFRALDRFESPRLWGGDFMRAVVRIAINTAMRRDEILLLKESMISLRDKKIMLPEGFCKNGKSRVVYLNEEAGAALRFWYDLQSQWPVRPIGGDLFPQARSTLETRVSSFEFPRLCREAGIRDFHFHDLRHTVASWLVLKGTPLMTVRDVLGHSSIQMTERYAHLAPQAARDAIMGLTEKQ